MPDAEGVPLGSGNGHGSPWLLNRGTHPAQTRTRFSLASVQLSKASSWYVDPKNPRVLYNSGFESGAYRSTDGGSTWNRIRGFNFKWSVILHPVEPAKIYVTNRDFARG